MQYNKCITRDYKLILYTDDHRIYIYMIFHTCVTPYILCTHSVTSGIQVYHYTVVKNNFSHVYNTVYLMCSYVVYNILKTGVYTLLYSSRGMVYTVYKSTLLLISNFNK